MRAGAVFPAFSWMTGRRGVRGCLRGGRPGSPGRWHTAARCSPAATRTVCHRRRSSGRPPAAGRAPESTSATQRSIRSSPVTVNATCLLSGDQSTLLIRASSGGPLTFCSLRSERRRRVSEVIGVNRLGPLVVGRMRRPARRSSGSERSWREIIVGYCMRSIHSRSGRQAHRRRRRGPRRCRPAGGGGAL